jgi:hypothetical protein
MELLRLNAIICYLLKGVISNRYTTRGQMTVRQRIIERNECKRKRSGLMFKILSQSLPGGTQVNHEKSARKTGVRAEVRNPNLHNKLYAPPLETTGLVMASYESRAGIGRSRPVSRLRPASAWRERKITHPLSTKTLISPSSQPYGVKLSINTQNQTQKIFNRRPFTDCHIYHQFGGKK